MNSLYMIFKYWSKSRKQFISQIVYLSLSTIFSTMLPIFIGRLVGAITDANSLLFNFFAILILASLVYFTNRAARLKGAEVSSRAIYYLRSDISSAIYRQSFSYFDKTETGQLISRATSDIEETQQIFGFGLQMGLMSILQLIGIAVGFILFSLQLGFLLIAAYAISIGVSYYITKKLNLPKYIK